MALRVIGVFVGPNWTDTDSVRLWVIQQAVGVDEKLIVVNDDPNHIYQVILRQCRCSGVLSAVVRVPVMARTEAELTDAQWKRDLAIARLSHMLLDFGSVRGGSQRFTAHGCVETKVLLP